jgi:hypothetical protein
MSNGSSNKQRETCETCHRQPGHVLKINGKQLKLCSHCAWMRLTSAAYGASMALADLKAAGAK